MHRRDFLRLGTTAAVGVAATGASAGTLRKLVTVEGASPLLSIGFASHGEGESQRLVDAERLRSGDSGFGASGARVTIDGFRRAEQRRTSPSEVHVSAFFDEDGRALPFLAWGHSARSTKGSSRATFTMPVNGREHLPLGIERRRPLPVAGAPANRFSRMFAEARPKEALPEMSVLEKSNSLVKFAVGNAPGVKLRRGTYFLALRESLWDGAPDWRTITVDNSGARPVLRRGDAPVDFDYIVVSVDYATV
ncbi:MAG TPA: hypothetical protein VF618_07610 [Thermoanaerobaculia bacterium]